MLFRSPKHPVSCIKLGLATCFIYDIIHISMPFSQIIPPSPYTSHGIPLLGVDGRFSMLLLFSCSVVSDSLQPHGLCSSPGSSVHGIFQIRILALGREEGGGFRMGNTCIPVADSF